MREGWRDLAIDRPPTLVPVPLLPVHCVVDMIERNDHGVSLSVYSLPPRRRFLFFFARLPIIVHEQRPPSFSTPLLVRRAFLVARSRKRGREKPPQLGGIIAFFAPKCLVLSL